MFATWASLRYALSCSKICCLGCGIFQESRVHTHSFCCIIGGKDSDTQVLLHYRRKRNRSTLTVECGEVLLFSSRTGNGYALRVTCGGVLVEPNRTFNGWALTITCVFVLISSSRTSGRYALVEVLLFL